MVLISGVIPTLVTPIPLQESEGEIIMWGGSHTNYTKPLPVKRARLSVYKSHQRQRSWVFFFQIFMETPTFVKLGGKC